MTRRRSASSSSTTTRSSATACAACSRATPSSTSSARPPMARRRSSSPSRLRPGRDPDGPPDARRQRRGRHPGARRAADPVAGARPDDLRLGQRRRAGDRGRGHRLPAQGLAARGAVPGGAGRVARRVRARLVRRDAADEPAPRPGPGGAERPRARGALAHRPGRDEPRSRRPAVHLGGDGQDAPAPHLREAERQRPGRRRRDGLRARAAADEPRDLTQPKVKQYASAPASRNSISKRRSPMLPVWRIS